MVVPVFVDEEEELELDFDLEEEQAPVVYEELFLHTVFVPYHVAESVS